MADASHTTMSSTNAKPAFLSPEQHLKFEHLSNAYRTVCFRGDRCPGGIVNSLLPIYLCYSVLRIAHGEENKHIAEECRLMAEGIWRATKRSVDGQGDDGAQNLMVRIERESPVYLEICWLMR
jgi:hypothetical protein